MQNGSLMSEYPWKETNITFTLLSSIFYPFKISRWVGSQWFEYHWVLPTVFLI